MKYVLAMTLGVIVMLFGCLCLTGSPGFAAVLIGLGALVLFKAYKPWRKWYSKKDQERKDIADMNRRLKYAAETIVSVSIAGNGSQTNVGSAIGRAVVGDFIAGDVGAVVGAVTAKQDGTTKFLVTYEDGHTVAETVKDNSARFKQLMAYIKT